MRGLRWSGKRRGDVAGAAQILCAAELCGRAARVWRRRLRGGDGSPGGCGLGRLKRAPGFWACVPRERRGEIPGGDHGVQLRGGGKKMTLTCGSGRAVREERGVGERRGR